MAPHNLRVLGRLRRHPEFRRMPSGRLVASFTIELTDSQAQPRQDAGRSADCIGVLAHGELADACRLGLKKGRQVYVEGQLQTRNWEDSRDRKLSRTELVATRIASIGKRGVRRPGARL